MSDNYTAIVITIKEQNDEFDSIVSSALIKSDTDFMVIHNLLGHLTSQPPFDKAIAEITFNAFEDYATTYHIELYPDVSAMLVYRFTGTVHRYLGMITNESVTQLDSVTTYDEYVFDLLKSFVGTVLLPNEV